MFEPGQSGNPNGRPKGSLSEQTKRMKTAFALLVENNLENMTLWLEQIAATDPGRAMDTVIKLSERFVPKLSQQQLTDGEGESLFKNITFKFGDEVKAENTEE